MDVGLADRAEFSEVSVFEKLVTDIRHAVNVGRGKNSHVAAGLTVNFPKVNIEKQPVRTVWPICKTRDASGSISFVSDEHKSPT